MLSPFPRSLHPRSPNPSIADTLILLPSPIHLMPRLSVPHLSLSPSLSEPSPPPNCQHQPPSSAGPLPSLQLHLPSLLSCQSAINTPAKDLESIQALAPLAPSSHPFLKVLEYPSSLFQAPGLGWGKNGVGVGGREPSAARRELWGGGERGLCIEVASHLFCDGSGGSDGDRDTPGISGTLLLLSWGTDCTVHRT